MLLIVIATEVKKIHFPEEENDSEISAELFIKLIQVGLIDVSDLPLDLVIPLIITGAIPPELVPVPILTFLLTKKLLPPHIAFRVYPLLLASLATGNVGESDDTKIRPEIKKCIEKKKCTLTVTKQEYAPQYMVQCST